MYMGKHFSTMSNSDGMQEPDIGLLIKVLSTFNPEIPGLVADYENTNKKLSANAKALKTEMNSLLSHMQTLKGKLFEVQEQSKANKKKLVKFLATECELHSPEDISAQFVHVQNSMTSGSALVVHESSFDKKIDSDIGDTDSDSDIEINHFDPKNFPHDFPVPTAQDGKKRKTPCGKTRLTVKDILSADVLDPGAVHANNTTSTEEIMHYVWNSIKHASHFAPNPLIVEVLRSQGVKVTIPYGDATIYADIRMHVTNLRTKHDVYDFVVKLLCAVVGQSPMTINFALADLYNQMKGELKNEQFLIFYTPRAPIIKKGKSGFGQWSVQIPSGAVKKIAVLTSLMIQNERNTTFNGINTTGKDFPTVISYDETRGQMPQAASANKKARFGVPEGTSTYDAAPSWLFNGNLGASSKISQIGDGGNSAHASKGGIPACFYKLTPAGSKLFNASAAEEMPQAANDGMSAAASSAPIVVKEEGPLAVALATTKPKGFLASFFSKK